MSYASGRSIQPWICCQLGARERYAVPRALFQDSQLKELITDAWISPRFKALTKSVARLDERYDLNLAGASITSFTPSACLFEISQRLWGNDRWSRIVARNHWFQIHAARRLRNLLTGNKRERSIVFAYSYSAKKIFEVAKTWGCITVLGQIDPGPHEEEIVYAEAILNPELEPNFRRAPAHYWSEWQTECALADHIVVNSNWSASGIQTAGIPSKKVAIIPLAYQPSLRHSRPERVYPRQFTFRRPLRVLFLGQINLRKGVAHILGAAHRLLPLPIEFWMVGPVQIAKVPSHSELPNVRWFGPMPNSATVKYYQGADVFILPTLSDGFALTQLEAMAYRLPVIASTHCGAVVRDGIDGLLLTEVSASTIADVLGLVAHEPKLLQELSSGATPRPEFSIEALGENLQQLASLYAISRHG